ncbi:MAG: Hsp70 family protein [Deltaproteobacteria bacterium]|jgi:molecular chaperone DnaK (HSP70)|nr:Hsp70 family protein [Deltaproteobacteria bacterium]
MISLKKLSPLAAGSLIPSRPDPGLPAAGILNNTFIGIDFGTSTTVVSYFVGRPNGEALFDTFKLEQPTEYGGTYASELINSVIAWHDNKLIFGRDAYALKRRLFEGSNLFSSFKMMIGVDIGPTYPETKLSKKAGLPYVIEYASDAAAIFFERLLDSIKKAVKDNHFPENLVFSVSVPASFEANQREELVKTINKAGFPVSESCLIDEPNSAFLSYIHQEHDDASEKHLIQLLKTKETANVLVYDFGAGTCDISILEIIKDKNNFKSRNRSISRFTALGGDDLDREIARDALLEQLLKSAPGYDPDLRHINEKIIPILMPAAEQLKISAVEMISEMNISTIDGIRKIGDKVITTHEIQKFKIKKIHELHLKTPSLTLKKFADVLERFAGKYNPDKHFNSNHVYSPVDGALKKIAMSPEDLDAVLFIGGSSNNPVVRRAVMENMPPGVVEIVPKNLQTHVSMGACLHSVFYNGYGRDLIKPITPEAITLRIVDGKKEIIPASTEVPTKGKFKARLKVAKENQSVIELPFYAGDNKILGVVEIKSKSPQGFKYDTIVLVSASITHDKLLRIEAEVQVNETTTVKAETVLLSPLANRELTEEETKLLKAKQKFNIDLLVYGGKNMPVKTVLEYADAAADAYAYETAADMLATAQSMDSSLDNSTSIGHYYSLAERSAKAERWFKTAYQKKKNYITAYNLSIYETDKSRKISLLRESLDDNPNFSSALYYLGIILHDDGSPEGRALLKRYANIEGKNIKSPLIKRYQLQNLISCADILSLSDLKQKASERLKNFKQGVKEPATGPFDKENLLGVLMVNQPIIYKG